MNRKRKWLALLLVALMVFGQTANIQAADANARTISIFRIDGDNVTISRNGRATTPRPGQNLASGQTIYTGADSAALLQLDTDSIL